VPPFPFFGTFPQGTQIKTPRLDYVLSRLIPAWVLLGTKVPFPRRSQFSSQQSPGPFTRSLFWLGVVLYLDFLWLPFDRGTLVSTFSAPSPPLFFTPLSQGPCQLDISILGGKRAQKGISPLFIGPPDKPFSCFSR